MTPETIKIEVQYFKGCPNSAQMIANVKEAIKNLENVEYREVLVETNEDAERIKFRGSPTVLINDKDLEGIDAPFTAVLNCRYYPNGLPNVENIREYLKKFNNEF